MNILIASDDNYVPPASVLIKSLCENCSQKVEIFYLFDSLKHRNYKRLVNDVERWGGTIHCIEVNDSCFDNVPVCAHFTKETYFRLLATELLPDTVDRILYLNPDIIVTKDICEFYEQSFVSNGEEKALIACEDAAISYDKKVYSILNMPDNVRYFNAGVILMNMRKLRQLDYKEAIFEFIYSKGKELRYLDQDALNAFYFDKTVFCEEKYNLLLCNVSANSKKISDAYILHFAGPHKPWKVGYKHGARETYIYYTKKSGRYMWLLKSKTKSFMLKSKRIRIKGNRK